jgi:hypothetical protein
MLAVPVAPALAQGGSRQTASLIFSQQSPASGSGLHISIDYRNPGDAQAKPFAVQRIVTTLAPGSRIDTTVPGQCKLSDAELTASGSGGCPATSIVGSGTVTLSATSSDPTTAAHVTLINNAGELIFLVETMTTPPARMIIHSPVRGATITNEIPRLPGGPPDGAVAIRTADLRLSAVSSREGSAVRNYITTPPSCPASGVFGGGSLAFTYFDGVSQTVPASSPCVDTVPPKVSLTGIPRHSCVRGAVRARLRVVDTSSLRGVLIRLNGRRIKSTRHKSIRLRIRRSRLRRGHDRLKVVAVDRRGNRATLTRHFFRCR